MRAYDNFVDLLVQSVDPRGLAHFEWSDETRHRVQTLKERRENNQLSREERTELKRFAAAEHFLQLARARLQQRLSSE
ncbi:MAG: hypothetical protein KY475_27080 [Planctomycetes bacterium]|nr:hypothetical protein [Planctomycetota bacterium]